MKVRDHTKRETEYQGRTTDAADAACPCRSCYQPHDCGRTDWDGRWVSDMRCAMRERGGCPSPQPEPEHIPMARRVGPHRLCCRCRERLEE